MSLLFDALQRLQDNDSELEGQKGSASSPPPEPYGAVPLSVNSAVFLRVPGGGARVGQAVVSTTARKPRRAKHLVPGIIGFLLLVVVGWVWFALHDSTIHGSQQTLITKPAGVTIAVSVPPPPQMQPAQDPALPSVASTPPVPEQIDQEPIVPPANSDFPSVQVIAKEAAGLTPAPEAREPMQPGPSAEGPGLSAQQATPEPVVAEPTSVKKLAPTRQSILKKPAKQAPFFKKPAVKMRPITQKMAPRVSPTRQTPPHQPIEQSTQASKKATTQTPSALHVRLNPGADPLQEGYVALTEGRLEDAERKYLEVIDKSPHERDALLGLAVIAHRKLQIERASDFYQQVLREDPANATATAALINLSAQVDPVAAESHLKQLLDQKQTSAELQHALGNVLARQKRWGEAQQAFFRAYSLEPGNAVYAYNLAVALDRLGQPAAALAYYEKLAQLTKPGNTAINRDIIQRRVQELQGSIAKQP